MDHLYRNRDSQYTSLTRSDSDTSSLLTPTTSSGHPTTTKTTYQAYRPGLVHQQSVASIRPEIIEETPSPPHASSTPRDTQRRSRPVGPSTEGRPYADETPSGSGNKSILRANSSHIRQTSSESNDATLLRESRISGDLSKPVSKQYFRNARRIRQEWRTGKMRRFPWRGVGALFVIVLLTGSCVSLVFAARHTRPEQWATAQPNVYVSIMELLMNLLTLTAFLEGFTIAFWTSLLRRTTTLSDVHDTGSSASSLRSLIIFRWNKLGFATLGSLLSLARGPFFQRTLSLTALPTLEGTSNHKTYFYALSLPFLIVAIAMSLLSILFILPLYTNYSLLGRSMSLSPIEIARAFGAPMFDGVDGNAGTRDILFEKGHVRVKYGVVESERHRGEKVLRVEETERGNVRTPREGEIFG